PVVEVRQEMVDILVLAQPVGRGGVITENVLVLVPYPKKEMVEGLFFTEKLAAIGKRARHDLQQGIPLTPNMLTDAPTGSYAAFSVPRGMVAISIPISPLTSVSNAIQPGDHVSIIASILLVDLDPQYQSETPNMMGTVVLPGPVPEALGGGNAATLTHRLRGPTLGGYVGRTEFDQTMNQAFYSIPSEPQRPRLVSQMLVQDAIVLWVGEFPVGEQVTEQPTPTPVPEGEVGAPPPVLPKITPSLISLIVTPQDAVTLNYLMLSRARLSLVLRSTGDDQPIPTDGVTLKYILDRYNIPNPEKLPFGIEPRLDIVNYPVFPNEQSTDINGSTAPE
ncbi:MAG: RcpC/CpaB family pilus assembly protein, partial [Anaerolineaceae bacterium]|nr:RcpC/CpaB family pilus assembly protein [Anaerolineaceae bacterium]